MGSVSDETDDIGGAQGTKIDLARTETLNEEISRVSTVISDRRCGKPSVA
jgi:hypothetical protein